MKENQDAGLAIPTSSSKAIPVSLCMIVKDEEERLGALLESVRDWVDEICIVDTGSTDSTMEIVTKYADVWDEVQWQGFSHARNRSIEMASNDWIFILDADDEIEKPSHFFPQFVSYFDNPDVIAFQCQIANPLVSGQSEDRLFQIRCFRNQPDLRYYGLVHNQIARIIKERQERTGELVVRMDLRILHHGYDTTFEVAKAKYEGRLKLCDLQLQDDTMHIEDVHFYRYQKAKYLFSLRRRDEAWDWFDKVDYEVLLPYYKVEAQHLRAKMTITRLGELAKEDPKVTQPYSKTWVQRGVTLLDWLETQQDHYSLAMATTLAGRLGHVDRAYKAAVGALRAPDASKMPIHMDTQSTLKPEALVGDFKIALRYLLLYADSLQTRGQMLQFINELVTLHTNIGTYHDPGQHTHPRAAEGSREATPGDQGEAGSAQAPETLPHTVRAQ